MARYAEGTEVPVPCDPARILQTLAWQAGIFEGEGSVEITRPARQLGTLRTGVVNTDRQVITSFEDLWGGSTNYVAACGNRRGFWRWRVTSWQAVDFLTAMWPLLHTDKYRARTVLGVDFQAQKRQTGGHVTAGYRDRQWAFYEGMRRLNQRGIQASCPALEMGR